MSLLLFSLLVFTSYLSYIAIRCGVQPSISDSYYLLNQSEKWMFTFATWAYVIPLALEGIGKSELQDVLLLFAATLLCLVGVMADFRSLTERKWHQIGAEGGILLAFVWILTTPIWYIAIPSIIGILVMFKKKPTNHTWWIEVLAYLTITLAIYLNSL